MNIVRAHHHKWSAASGARKTVAIGLALVMAAAGARAAERSEPDAALVERVKDAVIKELRDSGALERAVESGIKNYVERQRAETAQRQQREGDARAAAVRPVTIGRDHVFGDINAEVSLIEYSDFECPYCKRFHGTAKQLVESFKGRINWVYRHFPLEFHNPAAQRQAEAAECVAELGGNDSFWTYADLIYAATPSNGKGVPAEKLPELAASLGVDRAKFAECLRSGRMTARVKEDFTEGQAIGIQGTPGNILRNNRTGATTVRQGALPFERMKAAIDPLLRPR